MLFKIPTHTLTQGLQLCDFLIGEFFTIKQDVGIARILKTQEINFVYKKQPIWKRQQNFYVIIHNKNKLFSMPFATKHNKRIKVQGSLETLRYLIKIRQDTLLAPHHTWEKHCP